MLSEVAPWNRKTATFVPGRMSKQEIMYKDEQKVSCSCEHNQSIVTLFYCAISYTLAE